MTKNCTMSLSLSLRSSLFFIVLLELDFSTETCPKVKPVHVEKKWLHHKGPWYVVMSNGLSMEKAVPYFTGTSGGQNDEVTKRQSCVDIDTKSFGVATSVCQFKHFESQTCSHSYEGVLSVLSPISNQLVFIKTDNRTYNVLSMCTSRVIPYWVVISKSNKHLPKKTEDEIMKKLLQLGFEKDNGEEIRPTKFTFRDCTDDD